MSDLRPAAEDGSRTTVGFVSGTAFYNAGQNLVFPAWSYLPLNAVATVGLLKLADRLGITREELGTTRPQLRKGIRVGVRLAIIIAIAFAVAIAVPETRVLFRDARVVGVSVWVVLFETLLRIPIGTALFEETLFRGVLLSWLLQRTSRLRAVVLSSAIFGLWHVLPALALTTLYQDGAIRDLGRGGSISAVLAAVVLTGIAGAFFAWLRLRTDSLATPVIVHAVVNSASYLGAALVANIL